MAQKGSQSPTLLSPRAISSSSNPSENDAAVMTPRTPRSPNLAETLASMRLSSPRGVERSYTIPVAPPSFLFPSGVIPSNLLPPSGPKKTPPIIPILGIPSQLHSNHYSPRSNSQQQQQQPSPAHSPRPSSASSAAFASSSPRFMQPKVETPSVGQYNVSSSSSPRRTQSPPKGDSLSTPRHKTKGFGSTSSRFVDVKVEVPPATKYSPPSSSFKKASVSISSPSSPSPLSPDKGKDRPQLHKPLPRPTFGSSSSRFIEPKVDGPGLGSYHPTRPSSSASSTSPKNSFGIGKRFEMPKPSLGPGEYDLSTQSSFKSPASSKPPLQSRSPVRSERPKSAATPAVTKQQPVPEAVAVANIKTIKGKAKPQPPPEEPTAAAAAAAVS